MSHETQDGQQALRTALVLIGNGILTQRAGRAMAYFNEHGVFCQPLTMPSGDLGIVFLERWYTPAAFNALMDGGYADAPETPADEAAEPAPDGDEPETAEAQSLADDDTPPPSPDDVVRELRSDAATNAAKLEQLYEASSEQTDGEAGLAWALGLLLLVVLFAVVMVWAFFNGAWR